MSEDISRRRERNVRRVCIFRDLVNESTVTQVPEPDMVERSRGQNLCRWMEGGSPLWFRRLEPSENFAGVGVPDPDGLIRRRCRNETTVRRPCDSSNGV